MTGRPQVAPTVLYDKQLDKSKFRLSSQTEFENSIDIFDVRDVHYSIEMAVFR